MNAVSEGTAPESVEPQDVSNLAADDVRPYPGLRPFSSADSGWFFGREGLTDALIAKMAAKRFLAVVGASGSGKSSLVRAGFLPALDAGYLPSGGSSWLFADFRPGARPIARLAEALDKAEYFRGAIAASDLETDSYAIRRLVQTRRLDESASILILVDHFEELFRFRPRGDVLEDDEQRAFVRLLLEASAEPTLPVYVVITIRSDFLGDCARFRDLPEAISNGQFLIPRMTREQRRLAIEGPARAAGATMANRLVQKLLNDAGDEPDQLPVLQHALMRTWNEWRSRGHEGPIDLEDYRAVGETTRALSIHADEAYEDAARAASDGKRIVKRVFQRLWDRDEQGREVRRPRSLHELAEVAEASDADVISCLEKFREPRNSFLMPPPGHPLGPDDLLDVTHECLLRLWKRLATEWIPEERESKRTFLRLVDRADQKSPMVDPALQTTLDWWAARQPNPAWAARYDPQFHTAEAFLRESERARTEQGRLRQSRARRRIRDRFVIAALVAFVIANAFAYGLYNREYGLRKRIEIERNRALEARTDAVTRALTSGAAAQNSNLSNADLAALLAATALGRGPAVEATDALAHALATLPLSTRVLRGMPRSGKVLLNRTGTRLVVVGPWGAQNCELGETVRCEAIPPLPVVGPIVAGALSEDGAILAVAANDTVLLADALSGREFFRMDCGGASCISMDTSGSSVVATCGAGEGEGPRGHLILRGGDGRYAEVRSETNRALPAGGLGQGWTVSADGTAAAHVGVQPDDGTFVYKVQSFGQRGISSKGVSLKDLLRFAIAPGDLGMVASLHSGDGRVHVRSVWADPDDSDRADKPVSPAGRAADFSLSDDGALLATISIDGILQLWDTETSQEEMRLNLHWSEASAPDLAFDAAHGRMALTDGEGTVFLVQAAAGQWLRVWRPQLSLSDDFIGADRGHAAWLAVSLPTDDVTIRKFSPSKRLFLGIPSWSPDLETRAFVRPGVVRFERAPFERPEPLCRLGEDAVWPAQLALSDHGEVALVAGFQSPARPSLMDVPNLETSLRGRTLLLTRLTVPAGGAACPTPKTGSIPRSSHWAFAHEDETAWADSANEEGAGGKIVRTDLKYFDLESADTDISYSGILHGLAVTENGRRLAIVDDPEEEDEADEDAPACKLSTTRFRVTVWEASAAVGVVARKIAEFNHPDSIRALALSYDGRYLASADSDVIHIWDVESAKDHEVARLAVDWAVERLAFSSDEERVLVIGRDRIESLAWRRTDLIDEACRRVGRDLTDAEFAKYARGEVRKTMCRPDLLR